MPKKEYWLRFDVNNLSDKNIMLSLSSHYNATIYFQNEKLEWIEHSVFFYHNNLENNYNSTKNLLEISSTGIKTQYYLKIQTRVKSHLSIFILKPASVMHIESNLSFYIGILYGFLYLILVYSFVLYLKNKEKIYILYFLNVLFVLCYVSLTTTNLGHYLYQFRSDYYIHTVFTVLFGITSLLSTRIYTNSKVEFPKIDRLIFIFMILRVISFFLGIIFDIDAFNSMNIEAIGLGLSVYVSYLKYKTGDKPSFYFMLACLVMGLTFVVRQNFNDKIVFFELLKPLFDFSTIPYFVYYYDNIYLTFIAFMIDVIFFSFGISERMRMERELLKKQQSNTISLQNEVIDLKDHYNFELENEVFNRTKDLKESYEELHSLHNILKIDNEKLNTNIKSINESRILVKNISFDEFKISFPDNDTCLSYLANAKWKDGYQCKKCRYKKFYEGDITFARRCKLCQYKETATSHILLDNVKFSLQKAMYIVYTIYDNDSTNMKSLSDGLELRHATCLKFANRVMEAKLILKKEKKKTVDWTSLLLINYSDLKS